MDKLKLNLTHLPTTIPGIIVMVLAALPQIPGFNKVCGLNDTLGTVLTFICGVAGFIMIVMFGNGNTPNTVNTVNSTNNQKTTNNLPLWVIGVVLLGIFTCLPLYAQDPTDPTPQKQFVAAYTGVNSDAATNPFGGGMYGRSLKGPLFSVSGYEATSVPGETLKVGMFNMPRLKFTNWSGLALKTWSTGPVAFWLKGAPGIAATGDEVKLSGAIGAFGTAHIHKGWGIHAGVDFLHDGINGDGYVIRIGPYWGK